VSYEPNTGISGTARLMESAVFPPGDDTRSQPESPLSNLEKGTSYSILLVEAVATADSCVIAAAELKQNTGITFTHESRIGAVIKRLEKQNFDAIIYDQALSNGKNHGNLDRIISACPETPLILLCDAQESEAALETLRRGVQEYLIKGTKSVRPLRKIIRQAILRKQWERERVKSARYDYLTGLPDRILFRERLEQAILDAQRNNGQMGILFVDLDQFKEINNTLGHEIGDKLLQIATARIRKCVRRADSVARSGGDEFAIIANRLTPATDAANLAKRVNTSLARPYRIKGNEIHCTASIGITVYPSDAEDADTLQKYADLALHRAKEIGRDGFQFYSATMNKTVHTRKNIESQIREALAKEYFVLHYQPNVDARNGALVGSEALIRLQHPELGMVPPNHFIPTAEETGLIVAIGEWVLQSSCAQAREWQDSNELPARVAVNLSPIQFRRPEFVDTVTRVLNETGLNPSNLELEITENVVMADFDTTEKTLQALFDLGVKLVIDDFGTGYSSLTYLKRFPVCKLKIDRSFVNEITTSPEDAAIVTAIIRMAHSLNLEVIGEGIETREQMHFLQEQGCNEFQGYLFTKAIDPEAYGQWGREWRGKRVSEYEFDRNS
jgi:diguanylate cyclase (GGDEF)-like protein